MAEREIDRSLRAKSGLCHRFGGLEHRIEVSLVVPRPAAPDKTVGNDTGEGRLLPIFLGARRHRDHVLMRQQRDRGGLGIAALPAVEQAVAADDLAFGRAMKGWKAFLDMRPQA